MSMEDEFVAQDFLPNSEGEVETIANDDEVLYQKVSLLF
jgi:hypothetical protein